MGEGTIIIEFSLLLKFMCYRLRDAIYRAESLRWRIVEARILHMPCVMFWRYVSILIA